MLFRRRKNGGSTAAIADRPPELAEADALAAAGRLEDAVELLVAADDSRRNPELDDAVRDLRRRLGAELVETAGVAPDGYLDPAPEPPALGPAGIPEVSREELTAPLLRAAMLERGCLLVRGLIDREDAVAMAAGIQRAYDVRAEAGEDAEGYYRELPQLIIGRPWLAEAGGMFAADSPKLMYEMLDLFRRAGVPEVVEGYLGERPVVSAEKCTLRRTTADLDTGWHQDGKFLGDVRALNLWLSLSRCGDVAPGLDVVPHRIETIQETMKEWIEDPNTGEKQIIELGVRAEKARELAGADGVSRPIFEPGDALLFDHLLLHSTAAEESMTEVRFAIESWFFTPSAFPPDYTPLAV